MEYKECDKCHAKTNKNTLWHEWGKTYNFCALCTSILEDADRSGLMDRFLSDDHGGLASKIAKSILDARISRHQGKRWKDL